MLRCVEVCGGVLRCVHGGVLKCVWRCVVCVEVCGVC